MFRLLLVRHGETQANLEHRCVGSWDVPLTEKGRQQAVLVAQRLAERCFDAIYASDLQRAWITAQTIMQGRDPALLIQEPRLREYNKGDWQGLIWDDIRRREEYQRWRMDREQAPPNGEKLSEVVARMTAVVDDARRTQPDGDVLFVGHGTSIRVLTCALLGIDPNLLSRLDTDNTSLTEFHFYPDGPVLHCLNDTGHLNDAGHLSDK